MKTDDVRLLSAAILILAAVELGKIKDAEIGGLALGIYGAYIFIKAYTAQKHRDRRSDR
jgi:hypothetical protein